MHGWHRYGHAKRHVKRQERILACSGGAPHDSVCFQRENPNTGTYLDNQ